MSSFIRKIGLAVPAAAAIVGLLALTPGFAAPAGVRGPTASPAVGRTALTRPAATTSDVVDGTNWQSMVVTRRGPGGSTTTTTTANKLK